MSSLIVHEIPAVRDLLALHRTSPKIYPHLLESVASGTAHSRYDILFAFPGETLTLDRTFTLYRGARRTAERDFLRAFDSWWQTEQCSAEQSDDVLPFRGGWFVFLAYELAQQIEPSLRLPRAVTGFPVAIATRCPAALITDHLKQKTYAVTEREHEPCLARMCRDFLEARPLPCQVAPTPQPFVYEEPPQQFVNGVERLLQYIADGDVFQVNLSRTWQIPFSHDRTALYQSLRRHNPGPFAAYASFGRRVILSSSPERLVRVTRDRIETRPIAGTRPRSSDKQVDCNLSAGLLVHPKERSEHVMLIDLERNDLGRVCQPGTVSVDELMALESYAHVHHIVSNVNGWRRSGTTPGDIIRAVFPGGTITGCPKVRCMEIIAELERIGRGAYTGSLGYINRDGDLDLNILIRTMEFDGETIHIRAGAGIVADSVPRYELQETRAKARGLLHAVNDHCAWQAQSVSYATDTTINQPISRTGP